MLLGATVVIIAVIAGVAMSNKYSDKPRSPGANNALITVLVIIGIIVLAVVFLLETVLRPIGQV
ncbi:hypothetical protein [Salinicola avicenniae]|uniref:hypothetical protein n=1 Tax=Salinicola avicenniae TaxID=2916836 RepID=UPI0020738152|nr:MULTISPECIES: hypothetical protein [unclassified Salinicola]